MTTKSHTFKNALVWTSPRSLKGSCIHVIVNHQLSTGEKITHERCLYKHHHDISNDIFPYMYREKTDYFGIQVHPSVNMRHSN